MWLLGRRLGGVWRGSARLLSLGPIHNAVILCHYIIVVFVVTLMRQTNGSH